MSFKQKAIEEAKAIFLVSLYFLGWFGSLMVLKVILLHEYKFEFYGASIVIVGSLVAAKAVLILENVPLFKSKTQPAIVAILLRTLLYLAGVFVILVLEKSFEARDEYGGFINALKNLASSVDSYHIWVNIICIFGALFFYNLGSVLNDHLGEGGFRKILLSPLPEKKKDKA